LAELAVTALRHTCKVIRITFCPISGADALHILTSARILLLPKRRAGILYLISKFQKNLRGKKAATAFQSTRKIQLDFKQLPGAKPLTANYFYKTRCRVFKKKTRIPKNRSADLIGTSGNQPQAQKISAQN